jgi:hypothetical protein
VKGPDTALPAVSRACLAALPTPLQDGVLLPGGARLLVKGDDLSGGIAPANLQ